MNLIYFIPAFRLIIGLFLIGTAAAKFGDLKKFSLVLLQFQLFPPKLARFLGYTYPFVEFLIGWWVLIGKPLVHSAIAAVVLFTTLNLLVLITLLRKKKVKDCGCYGTIAAVPLDWEKFWKNMIWVAISVLHLLAALEYASFYGPIF